MLDVQNLGINDRHDSDTEDGASDQGEQLGTKIRLINITQINKDGAERLTMYQSSNRA